MADRDTMEVPITRADTAGSTNSVRRRKTRTDTVTTYHLPGRDMPLGGHAGAEPGIDISTDQDEDMPHLQAMKADCQIDIIDFSETGVRLEQATNETLAKVLDQPRPGGDMSCRWISVNGLSWDVIKMLGRKYELHRLAIEDLVHTHSRTKVDWYREHAFMVLTLQKLVRLHYWGADHLDCPAHEDFEGQQQPAQRRKRWPWQPASDSNEKNNVLPRYLDRDGDGKVDETIMAHSGLSENSPVQEIRTLHRYENSQIPEHTAFMEKHSALAQEGLVVSVEQVSIFLLTDNSVISFFEHSADDVLVPILERIRSPETILRRTVDASVLLQAIVDAIVDLALPVKDAYNKARKELQIDALTNPNIKTSRTLHIFGEEIDMLQNLFNPIIALINALRDHNTEPQVPTLPPDTAASANGPTAATPKQPAAAQTATPLPSDPTHSPSSPLARTRREGGEEMVRKMSEIKRIARTQVSVVTNVSISPVAHIYFGDVLDHCITIIQSFRQMDASANNISTLIFNTVGAKTNSTMMILAVVTIIFAPLTFISGYFGMNFASGAGLAHPFAFFWLVAVPSLVAFMVLVFAVMCWDDFANLWTRRGIRARRRRRRGRVAAAGVGVGQQQQR
ncbi:hypothetical protein DV735_g4323, partial [Chaetothyriales sp. CBS 134920]